MMIWGELDLLYTVLDLPQGPARDPGGPKIMRAKKGKRKKKKKGKKEKEKRKEKREQRKN